MKFLFMTRSTRRWMSSKVVTLSDLQGSCIYCSFFGDLHPLPSPNMHQNDARSAAVATKPYKILTGTTLHLEANTCQK